MIIELFGPPAVGKTTFAHALTSRLCEVGRRAHSVLSYRPSELSSLREFQRQAPITRHMKVVRRVVRPAFEFITMMRDPFALSRDVGVAGKLIRTLPPGNPISFARHLQYISRLAHSWREAHARADIVVFDQGFVQEICSLALLDRTKDHGRIERALRMLPEPDLLIRLEASRDVLEARLGSRQRGQSWVERIFELDKQANLDTADVVNCVHGLLCRQGRRVSLFSSLDRHAVERVVELVELQFPPVFDASVQHA